MAINVLLDNCVLMKLFSGTEFSGYLTQIIAWHKSGEITLYCPEALLGEWEVHRIEKLKSVEGIIKQHELDIKKRLLLGQTVDIGDAQLSSADKLLSSQVYAIDALMAEAVPVKDHIAGNMMIAHKNAGKAPFCRNAASDNDALILFATCEHLLTIGERELFFFSSNHKDYSLVGHHEKLHPDILESYPGLSFHYFHEYVEGINALIAMGLTSTKTSLQVRNVVPVYVPVDFSQSIFDQIYQYLDRRFEDIGVLPKNLFITHAPFITADKAPRDAPPFTLQTDSKEVFELFSKLVERVNLGQLDWSAMKLDPSSEDRRQAEILNQLRVCFVHYISYNHKTVEIPVLSSNPCECLNCRIKRSEVNEDFFTQLTSIPEDERVSLKAAFLQYRVGNIANSVDMLKKLAEETEKSRQWLTYYIANYNLFLIGKMYRFSSPEVRDLPWIKDLQEIDMEKIFIVSSSPSKNDILGYLKEAEFISQATIRLKELSDKLKDNFIDQNRGWNDDVRALLDEYFEVIGFVEQNYIMLDYFSDMQTLTAYFLNGVFASYASHHELGGRMLHFTDTIVDLIVTYAAVDDITKCRSRYNIQIVDYIYNGAQSSLVTGLINLLNTYIPATAHFAKAENPGERFYWKRFKSQFLNAVTLCATVEISREEVNAVCEQLITFVKSEKLFHEYDLLKTLGYFIRNNASLINKVHLEAFLQHAYTSKLEQRDLLIHTISNISKIEELELRVTEGQWEELQARYLVNTEIAEDSMIISEICCLYDFLKDKSYREEISKFMLNYLKFKFNSDVYYTAVIHKLIRPTAKMTALYEQDMIHHAQGGRRPRIFQTAYYQSDTLDQYINFMFCLRKPFDARFIQAAGELDNYYRWVLDIDGYDYQDFHPDWLFNHLTKYYRKQFKKSTVLRHWMRKSALKSKNPKVSKFFIQLYTKSALTGK